MLSKNQIREIQSLQLKKFRDAKKRFIAEGIKTVTEVITSAPGQVGELFAVRDFLDVNRALLDKRGLRFTEVTEAELKKISLQSTPNGCLAVCRYFDPPQANFDFDSGFSFYLDDVRDPGNMGTIIRL